MSVNKVIRALRGGIDIVELHNHMLNVQPRPFTCTSGPPATAHTSPRPSAQHSTSPTSSSPPPDAPTQSMSKSIVNSMTTRRDAGGRLWAV
ncbi:DUF1259 domain-containing protein [Streptomyces sp. NPDC003480]